MAASKEFKLSRSIKLDVDVNGFLGASNYFKLQDPSKFPVYSSVLSNVTSAGFSATKTLKLFDWRLSFMAEVVRSSTSGNAVQNSDERSTVSQESYGGGVMVDLPIGNQNEIFFGAFGAYQSQHVVHPIVTEGPIINQQTSQKPFVGIVGGVMF